MTARLLRIVGIALLATCLMLGSGLVGPTLGTDSVTTIDPVTMTATGSRSALPAPFAQAGNGDDEGTQVINITAPDEEVEYTLTAPDLSPTDDVDLVDNDGNETNQDVIEGDSATGFIGNGNYDAYRFTGSVEEVQLDSTRIDELEVTIDGEPVDPRTLTADESATSETTTATTETAETTSEAEPTTTESQATTTSDPAATTDTTAGSGQSGFGMVMFVLIGIVSGLVLAGALVYVVRSDRSS